MSSLSTVSSPAGGDDSRGSSVSTRLQEEYDEILRYAVVTPNWDPASFPPNAAKRKSPLSNDDVMLRGQHITVDDDEEANTSSTTIESENPLPSPPRVTLPLEMDEDQDQSSPGQSERRGDDVDEDMERLDHQLDTWTLDLKRNVLAEFGHMKTRIVERHRRDKHLNQEKHDAQMGQLQSDLESAKELLVTYEESIGRKDGIVANLTKAIQKQKEKMELQRNFCSWKIHHCDQQREEFASKLARKHYWRTIGSKIWRAWHGILEAKWKQRVEKACQARAEQVCHKLSCDYEERITELNRDLEAANTEVAQLRKEREKYEETMKRAFMRGVCALNLEAMTMFREGTNEAQGDEEPMGPQSESGWIPQNPVNVLLETAPARVAPPPPSSKVGGKTRMIARGGSRRGGGSVLVERHDDRGVGGGEEVARHDKVPPARLGTGRGGKTHRLPTVKVVQ